MNKRIRNTASLHSVLCFHWWVLLGKCALFPSPPSCSWSCSILFVEISTVFCCFLHKEKHQKCIPLICCTLKHPLVAVPLKSTQEVKCCVNFGCAHEAIEFCRGTSLKTSSELFRNNLSTRAKKISHQKPVQEEQPLIKNLSAHVSTFVLKSLSPLQFCKVPISHPHKLFKKKKQLKTVSLKLSKTCIATLMLPSIRNHSSSERLPQLHPSTCLQSVSVVFQQGLCLKLRMRGTRQVGGPASLKKGCCSSSGAVARCWGSRTSMRSMKPCSRGDICKGVPHWCYKLTSGGNTESEDNGWATTRLYWDWVAQSFGGGGGGVK